MNGYSIIRTDGLFIPDLLIDLVNGEHLSGIFNEEQQNVILNGSQLDKLPINGHFLVIIITCPTTPFTSLAGRLLAPIAQLGLTAPWGFASHANFQGVDRL